MTSPGIPRSHGEPLLDRAAAGAIDAARERAGIGWPTGFPFPQRAVLTPDERKEALAAAKDACTLCGGLHAAPNTPACPRVRTFELNPDGRVVKGEFWQDGHFDSARILFVADAAEGADDEETPA